EDCNATRRRDTGSTKCAGGATRNRRRALGTRHARTHPTAIRPTGQCRHADIRPDRREPPLCAALDLVAYFAPAIVDIYPHGCQDCILQILHPTHQPRGTRPSLIPTISKTPPPARCAASSSSAHRG